MAGDTVESPAGNVAVAVMAKVPLPGRCKSRLALAIGPQAAAELYGAMLRDTLAGVDAAFADCQRLLLVAGNTANLDDLARPYLSTGWQLRAQGTGDLSTRLRRAMGMVCSADGAGLVMGSDAPLLPWPAVRSGLAELQRTMQPAVVMGPTLDGGYYCIGSNRADADLFSSMPWSTADVAARTRERCGDLGLPLMELPVGWDVDVEGDLERLRRGLAEGAKEAVHTAACMGRLGL